MSSVHELDFEASDEVNGTRSSKLGLALAVCQLQQVHGPGCTHSHCSVAPDQEARSSCIK